MRSPRLFRCAFHGAVDMLRSVIHISAIDEALPELQAPFAVLVDASDQQWADPDLAARLIKELLAAGCRYFVCFGPAAEALHDRIDESFLEHELLGIATTFHDEESIEDVAEFFQTIALANMDSGLVLVRDLKTWRSLF